jgi:ATP-dependent DNA helicase DinG
MALAKYETEYPAPPLMEGVPPATGIGVARFYEILASKLPGFEHRKEQYDLMVAIAGSLESRIDLAAQAPTGTGKSFAVGGAIISAFLGTGRTTVVATANNSLLEQYASKDLPFLQSMFPGLKWARAKGKNNYACIDKAEKLFGQESLFGQPDALRRLQSWYDSTESGDKEEIDFEAPEAEWSKINADDTCTGPKCAFYNECHFYKAKKEVKNADIIITNFDLVLLDAFNPEIQLFPSYNALILDEAHQLEDKAISKLETSLTGYQVASYINKAKSNYGAQDEALLGRISEATAALFTAYRSLLQQGQEKQSILPSQELIDRTLSFQKAMKALRGEIWKFKTAEGSRDRKAQENLMDKIDEASNAAMAAVTNHKRSVSWVEQTKTDIKVVAGQFIVAEKLYRALFSNPDVSVICLSATLGIKGKKPQVTAANAGVQPVVLFSEFRQRVGMIHCGEFDCPTPFNYRENCVLYLPKPPAGIEKPQSEGYNVWMLDQILQLVELSRGRALVLTTSTVALRNISGFLSRSTTLPVKMQSPEIPNGQLIKWFKETENAILVGTSSFWEGISIEGDDLKLVIIDKLPFTPHTEPIQQAREAWYKADPKRKAKAFMDLQIYPACIKLMQGFGRLIRTKTDTGVVAILDPRMTYGRNKGTFINSLPKAYQTSLINDPRLIEMLR